MKRKILILGIVGIMAFTSSHAQTYASATHSYSDVLHTFIDGHMNFDYKKFKETLGDNASFHVTRGNHVVVQSKNEVLNQMKELGKFQQACTYDSAVLSASDGLVIARVDFKYADGLQQNYLVMEKNADQDWKVTEVYKAFKDGLTPEKGSDITFNKP